MILKTDLDLLLSKQNKEESVHSIKKKGHTFLSSDKFTQRLCSKTYREICLAVYCLHVQLPFKAAD